MQKIYEKRKALLADTAVFKKFMKFSIPNWLLVIVILQRAAFRKKVFSGISKLVYKAKE